MLPWQLQRYLFQRGAWLCSLVLENKEKLTFAEIKKEFLKAAASALGETVTSVATKGLLSLVIG